MNETVGKSSFSAAKWIIWLGAIGVMIGFFGWLGERNERIHATHLATLYSGQVPSRHVMSVFKLPVKEETVSKDTQGRELRYQKGDVLRLKQLSRPPGRYWFFNWGKIPSLLIDEKVYMTSGASGEGKVKLRNAGQKEMKIQVEIFFAERRK